MIDKEKPMNHQEQAFAVAVEAARQLQKDGMQVTLVMPKDGASYRTSVAGVV